MFGKAQILNSTVWKRQTPQFQRLEKHKSSIAVSGKAKFLNAMFGKAQTLNSNVWTAKILNSSVWKAKILYNPMR